MIFIKKSIKNILYLVYFLINIIFFYKKKRITFISYPDASDNSWYLYKYCLRRLSEFELVWLLDDESNDIINKINVEFAKHNNNTLLILKRWSFKGFFAFCRSKYVFHTHGTYFFIKPAFFAPKIVNLWHGMPIKTIGHLDKKQDKYFCYSDYVICTSKYYQNIMAKVFDINIKNVLITGLPRNDILHMGMDLESKKIMHERINISECERYLVWLPTYRVSDNGEIRSDASTKSFLDELDAGFIDKLNALCSRVSCKVIIKLHPMDSVSISDLNREYSNIQIYDSKEWAKLNVDLYEVISGSKGVITDVSSVIIDCLSSGISVGYIRDSLKYYNRGIAISLEEVLKNIHTIRDPEDFISLCDVNQFYKDQIFAENSKNSCEKILMTFKEF